MKSGVVGYWAGVAGAFALGWLAVARIDSPRAFSVNPNRDPVQSSESQDGRHSDVSLPAGRKIFRGEELEDAITEISALANGNAENSHFTKRLFELAVRIPRKDFSHVMNRLRKPGSKGHDQLRAELLGYWMELNAPAARAYLTALPTRERARLIRPAADAWARIDSEGLLSWLRSLPPQEGEAVREPVRGSVALVLSQRDPALAVSLLLESPEGGNGGNGQVERTIFTLWAKQDPLSAAQRALLLPGGSGRLMALHIVMDQWISTSAETAMAWVREIPDSETAREAGTGLIARLMKTDSENATKFAVERGLAGDDTFLADLCRGWVERDSAGAFAWAQGLPSSPSRDIVLSRMLQDLANTEPQSAARIFATESSRGADMTAATGTIIQCLTKAADGATLRSFLEQLPEANRRELTNRATGGLVDQVAPASLLSIGLQLPSGPTRDQWLEQSVVWINMRKGVKQARQAIESLPAGSERDSLAAKAVLEEFSARRDIEEAVALAQTLPNGSDYVRQGVAGWLQSTDVTAARNWLRQTRALNDEEKQQLLRGIAVATTPAPLPAVARPVSKAAIPRP